MRLRYKPGAIEELKENKYIYFDPLKNKGKWSEDFENENPIYVEIGAGRGRFTLEMAERNPEINMIALEVDTKVFIYTARDFEESGLKNIKGIKSKAERILDYFEKEEIRKIFINFPNPWPKRKQHHKRLTHTNFLKMYKDILKDGGEIEFRTDDKPFFEDSVKYFEKEDFEIVYMTDDLKVDYFENHIVTEYEAKWRSRNVPICYLKAVKK